MKLVGFWKEFRSVDRPSFYEEVIHPRTSLSKEEELDLLYLKSGQWLGKVRTKFRCPLTNEIVDITTFTDGEWYWTSEYIFYFERYVLRLPQSLKEKWGSESFSLDNLKSMREEKISLLADSIRSYSWPKDNFLW